LPASLTAKRLPYALEFWFYEFIMSEGASQIVRKCIDLLRTFNPVTHSMDTHVLEALGNTKSPVIRSLLHFITMIALINHCFTPFRIQSPPIYSFNKYAMAGLKKEE
jgi:hypothetical protein